MKKRVLRRCGIKCRELMLADLAVDTLIAYDPSNAAMPAKSAATMRRKVARLMKILMCNEHILKLTVHNLMPAIRLA